jgi:hypothetical protein
MKRFKIRTIIGIIGCIILFGYIAFRVIAALNALP